MEMRTRRDRSMQNVPVVGWQEAADIQDVLLFGTVQTTDIGMTDGFGVFTTSKKPLLDVTHDWVVDANGVYRERKIDGADITAIRTSDNALLYVGEVDPVEGKVTLYTDAGKTTRAANTQARVTYWTPVPVKFDADGQLQVVVRSPLSGGGNVKIAVAEPLPEGTHTIGGVNLASPLPAGNNIVGKVIIRNTADGGGEDNSIRIRDSVGGNTTAIINPNTDDKVPGNYPLGVSSIPWGYVGDGKWDRIRTVKVFKFANITTTGDNTVWTPASGKRFRLMGLWLQNRKRSTDRTVLPDIDVVVKDGATQILPIIKLQGVVHDTTNNAYAGWFQEVRIDLGNGILSAAANNSLVVNVDGQPVSVLVWGTEE